MSIKEASEGEIEGQLGADHVPECLLAGHWLAEAVPKVARRD